MCNNDFQRGENITRAAPLLCSNGDLRAIAERGVRRSVLLLIVSRITRPTMREIKRAYVTMRVIVATICDINDTDYSQCKISRIVN